MQVFLTPAQAVSVKLESNHLFVRAAFYTGHSLLTVQELVRSDIFACERRDIVELAFNLGMTDSDTVEVVDASS